jgi:HEXXH motif-containing protein
MSVQTITLTDLTLPVSTATARTVLNAYLREAAVAFAELPPNKLPPKSRTLYGATIAAVQAMLKKDPRPLVAALRKPTLGALLWATFKELPPQGNPGKLDDYVTELCLLVHLELAAQGLVLSSHSIVRTREEWPRLLAPGLNLELRLDRTVDSVIFGSRTLTARVGPRDWVLPLTPGADLPAGFPASLTRPYHPIVDGIALTLADNNPLSMEEAHPDKFGNAIDLGGHPLEEWLTTLRASFAMVDKYLPHIGEEMRLMLKWIVPVGYHDQKHLSASYQEAVGTIYMTLHPNLMTMTEALVHEFQHNKINAAFHLDPMLHNAFSPLYKSPVRPDPRPLHGVILAVHAFQPIAKMYELMTAGNDPISMTPPFQRRFRDIIRMNRAGSRTVLENAQPTMIGQGLFNEMTALEQEQLQYEEAHWAAPAAEAAPVLPE